MSSIKITKGLPISLLIGVTQNDAQVALNDSTWTTTIQLKHQTESGPEPFVLTTSTAGNGYLVEISSEQTANLSHISSSYLLIIKSNKNDETVYLRNSIPISVVNDL